MLCLLPGKDVANGRTVRIAFTSRYGILACSQSRSPTLREVLELSGVYGDSFRTLPSEVQYGILAMVGHLMSDPVFRESVSGASTLIKRGRTYRRRELRRRQTMC